MGGPRGTPVGCGSCHLGWRLNTLAHLELVDPLKQRHRPGPALGDHPAHRPPPLSSSSHDHLAEVPPGPNHEAASWPPGPAGGWGAVMTREVSLQAPGFSGPVPSSGPWRPLSTRRWQSGQWTGVAGPAAPCGPQQLTSHPQACLPICKVGRRQPSRPRRACREDRREGAHTEAQEPP